MDKSEFIMKEVIFKDVFVCNEESGLETATEFRCIRSRTNNGHAAITLIIDNVEIRFSNSNYGHDYENAARMCAALLEKAADEMCKLNTSEASE